jgi:hypothetical protein
MDESEKEPLEFPRLHADVILTFCAIHDLTGHYVPTEKQLHEIRDLASSFVELVDRYFVARKVER